MMTFLASAHLTRALNPLMRWEHHKADLVPPSDSATMVVSRADLQLNMDSKLKWGPGLLNFQYYIIWSYHDKGFNLVFILILAPCHKK